MMVKVAATATNASNASIDSWRASMTVTAELKSCPEMPIKIRAVGATDLGAASVTDQRAPPRGGWWPTRASAKLEIDPEEEAPLPLPRAIGDH